MHFLMKYNITIELTKAAFELERLLRPDRAPSGTIAINKHAQFKAHRDCGAGAGQSGSLIVTLGDFVGGEVLVESNAHDIRYNAIEFDGWSHRHLTLPFVGERYTLVWFTPIGISLDDMWWWKEDGVPPLPGYLSGSGEEETEEEPYTL